MATKKGTNNSSASKRSTDTAKPKKPRKPKNNHSVELSTPWGRGRNIIGGYEEMPAIRVTGGKQVIKSTSDTAVSQFISERTKLHQVYIQEEARTKRLWLSLAVFLLIAALALIMFAPPGREILSYWIGGALLLFAGGAAGYKRVWGKSNVFSMGADQDQHEEAEIRPR